jgi:copper chaperone CopZ
MEQLALIVPGMWADHHVIAVRGLLRDVEGVEVTGASAMDATLRLEYDPATTDPQRIGAQLEQAGYAPGEAPTGGAPPTDKPAWLTTGVRVTVTDPADLTMSGDHRKY